MKFHLSVAFIQLLYLISRPATSTCLGGRGGGGREEEGRELRPNLPQLIAGGLPHKTQHCAVG